MSNEMTTPKKYIDLAQKIAPDYLCDDELPAMRATLAWLDRNPDQVPGRTITESAFNRRTSLCSELEAHWFKVGFLASGGSIVPDPEPTNLDRLQRLHDEWIKLPANKATPFPKWLDERGVTAPEADDE